MHRGAFLVPNLLKICTQKCLPVHAIQQLRNLRGKAPEEARTLKQRLEGIKQIDNIIINES